MRVALLLIAIGLTACADVPALENRIDATARNAPYPALINIDPLVAESRLVRPAAIDAENITPRIAALLLRANALRRPIIPAALRARMARGVDTSALP